MNIATLTGLNGGAGVNINGGTLIAGGEINVNSTSFDVANGGSVTAGAIRILGGGSEWASGNITLSDPNPFRTAGAVSLNNSFNVTAAPGSFTLTHTDLSAGYTNRDIAGKLLIGFFSLDGTHIDPDDNGFTGGLNDEADVVALNTFLRTNYTINGKYLELSDNTGDMRTLSVVAAVPEPAALSLLVLGGLALMARRRR